MVFRLIYSFVLALGIGYLTAKVHLTSLTEEADPQYGAWQTVQWLADETSLGDIPARLYMRANRALDQGLPVDNSEILTFEARTDSAGEPLVRSCGYTISAPGIDVAWWSLYLDTPKGRIGPLLNPKRTGFLPDKSFSFKLGAGTSGEPDPFTLVYRLYRSDADVRGKTGADTLPTIVRETCT